MPASRPDRRCLGRPSVATFRSVPQGSPAPAIPRGERDSALRLSLAGPLGSAAVMLCDLRLGLSLSGLLYDGRALDTDIPVTPILLSTRYRRWSWGAGSWAASLS